MLGFISKWKDKLADYVDMRVRIVKLDFIERTSQVLSFFTFTIVCFLLVLPILLFMGIGVAEFFADLVGSRAGGYLIITGIYMLMLGLLFIYRKTFIAKFTGLFIRVMTENEDEDEDDEKPAKK
jgi:hypothetical protein